MNGRVGLVDLAVRDVERSTAFYQALGWHLSSASVAGEVSFFNTEGGLLAVWGHQALADDADLPAGPVPAYRGASYAVNLESRGLVEELLGLATAAGGMIARPAQETEWGGYNGYFLDPDGHLWEAAHSPGWPIGPDGRSQLPL
ncbi:MAG: VOC family protein [Chloroflexota bacterium]